MIIGILLFAFLLIGLVIGTKTRTVGEILAEEPPTPPPILSANYFAIAEMEEAMNEGSSFHVGLPRDNGQKCQCNTICHPEKFYIPEVQPPPIDPPPHIPPAPIINAYAYGYGLAYEWRDHNGE